MSPIASAATCVVCNHVTPSSDILARLRSIATKAPVVGSVVIGLLLSAGCTGSEQDDTPVPTVAPGSDVTVVSNDSGTTGGTADPLSFPAYGDPEAPIYVAVGRHFALMLPADPSSGFHWSTVKEFDRAIVAPLGTQFMTTDTAIAGNPDSEILSFVATGEGTTDVIVRYSSSNNQPGDNDRELTFTVTVTADGLPPTTSQTDGGDTSASENHTG